MTSFSESDDQILAGVSSTALMVAAARAIETNHPRGLVRDEYAERFIRSARSNVTYPLRIEDAGGDSDLVWGTGGRYFALRTRAFDDFLVESAAQARQIVMFGSGLDSRFFRLDLPADASCYEIDQRDVLTFKKKVIAATGKNVAERKHEFISINLGDDWFAGLRAAGFDETVPTTWVAEGILSYLPATVENNIFDTIMAHSVPGSRIGFEIFLDQDKDIVRGDEIYRAAIAKIGVNLVDLLSVDPRPDTVDRLRAAGWNLTIGSIVDFTRRYGRGPETNGADALSTARWVFGGLPD